MTNMQAANKIDEILKRKSHFTDLDFVLVNENDIAKCPRPDKSEWLFQIFENLMKNLKTFLKKDPSSEEISEFLNEQIVRINPSDFMRKEYELLLIKYSELPLFGLNIHTVHQYLEENKAKLKFLD